MGIPRVGTPAGAPEGGRLCCCSSVAAVTLPYAPVSLWHRSSGLVLRSLKTLILILRISWGPASYTPEPPRSDAYCVWSRICKPRSDLLSKLLCVAELCSGCAVLWGPSGVL